MKVIAALLFLLFAVLFCALSFAGFNYFEDYHGLWIIFRIVGTCGPLILAIYCFQAAWGFLKGWQFDVELSEMLRDCKQRNPGPVSLDCSTEKLATEFWRLYKDSEKDRIYDREKYDAKNRKMRFKKRY